MMLGLGTLLVTHWLAGTKVRIGGALLVAVPDPETAGFPPRARGFNAASGLGEWTEGHRLLESLRRRIE